MARIFLRRILVLGPVILATLSAVFALTLIIPGDAATYMAGMGATEESIEKLRADLGLSDPVPVRYMRYVGNALRGDFGYSMSGKEPVLDVVLKRVVASLNLALAGIAVALIIGIPAGIISALYRDSWLDHFVSVAVLVTYATPPFWLALLLILLFSLQLGWLPPTGSGDVRNLVLPALALGVSSAAIIARFTRSSFGDVLDADYIRTARAKGLKSSSIHARHALKNALLPVVTVTGLQLGILIGRSVVIESIFAYPGIGRLMLLSIDTRDIPLLQGSVFAMATIVVLINLFVDMAYVWLDPRIRLSNASPR